MGMAQTRQVIRTEVIGSFGGYQTMPVALNNAGQVVGTITTGTAVGSSVFLWSREDGFRLIVEGAYVSDINDRGEVVGSSYECSPTPDGNSSCAGRGFVWHAASGIRSLGEFQPTAVNNRGDMAGACVSASLQHTVPCAMHDGIVTKWECEANKEPCGGYAGGINARGDVVGAFEYYDYDPEAILWPRHAAEVRFGTAGTPWDINNAGTVTGSSYGIPTIWPKRGEPRHILAPSYGTGVAVNAAGLVAGRTWEYPWKGFAWNSKRDSVVFLAPDAFISESVDVNDKGEILGFADAGDGTAPQPVIWRLSSRP
jgi:uncharacterized membrane protein